MNKTAVVIGGGIQGCLIALQLTRLKYQVRLIDKEERLFSRASLNQEGKIHLGMVYALDESLETPHKMIEDALNFAPIVEELLEQKIEWTSLVSSNFLYPVHIDSLYTPDNLEERYCKIEKYFSEILRTFKRGYLGTFPNPYFERINLPEWLNPEYFTACFNTPELAINPEILRFNILQAISENKKIEVYTDTEVVDISRNHSGFKVTSISNQNEVKIKSDIVINASWESKKKIDNTLNIENEQPWHVRLKLGFKGRVLPNSIEQSMTIVHGPFGDFVNFDKHDYCYFSWYPHCKIDHTSDSEIPNHWNDILNGNFESIKTLDIFSKVKTSFSNLFPGHEFEIEEALAGTIVAYARHDIDKKFSGLHKRNEKAVAAYDGYFSIHTSKFTSAPHNSLKLVNML